MLICSVCGRSYAKGRVCPLDGASLHPAKKSRPDALFTTPVDSPSLQSTLGYDPDFLSTDTDKDLDAVPEALLKEDAFSASDLLPSVDSLAPEEMVMVRGGKFLPPVPLNQAEPTLPTIQAISLSTVRPEVEPPEVAPFEEGFFSASDLYPVSALPSPVSPKRQSLPSRPPASPESAVSDMLAKIVTKETRRPTQKAAPEREAAPSVRPKAPPPPDPSDPWVGFCIGGYQINKKLGAGGTGSVYRATYTPSGRDVAIKILHAQQSTQPDSLWRLFDEARAANKIQHPHIIEIIDVGVISNSKSGFLIMELLEGRDLDRYLKERRMLSPPDLRRIFIPICEALFAAHAAGIIHRDLKPDNVFLCRLRGREDFVKLLDFGIAKLSDRGNNFRTQAGVVVGTPAYMSPEQASGSVVDARADVYSLGVMLYQCLTGEIPFRASTAAELLLKQVFEAPPPLHTKTLAHNISPQLRALVQRCLEKDPALRPQSMGEILQVLRDPETFTTG